MTTVPTFDATDETAFDADRALTAEHGRRFVRNSLAIWNERCGHVGHAEQLVGSEAQALTTRRIATANWAYVGPWVYFCPVPTGLPNGARPVGSIRLLLTGRCSVVSPNGTNLYILNQTLNAPGEATMDANIAGGLYTEQWAELGGEDAWSAALTVPVVPGRNVLWLAVRCAVLEETEVDLADETFGGPYLAEFATFSLVLGTSHPALFAAGTADADATAYAVRVARTNEQIALGFYDIYTVPMTIAVPSGNANAGQYLLWEPFRSQLSRIQPPLTSDEWTVNPAAAVAALRYDLVVVDIDSATVDGSQVWVLEDYQFGAGLRWWQLTSATQFRSSAELVAVARRAVVPQVCMVQPVVHVGTFAPYPLPATEGKPRQWRLSDTTVGGITVDLADQPPFAIPTTTRTLRAVVPVAVVLWNSRTRRESIDLSMTAKVVNQTTGDDAVADAVVTSVPVLESGGMDGGSVLARTIGWSALTGDTGTRYGTEGLTLRSDWYRWTLIELAVTVPVSVFTGDVGGTELLIDITAPGLSDYWLAVGSIAVTMEGR
jgi:hypothetical protein